MEKQTELLPEPQYITVKFNPWDRKTYTYENPFDPVKAGDEIEVKVRGEISKVIVERVDVDKPSFKCNQIERKTNGNS